MGNASCSVRKTNGRKDVAVLIGLVSVVGVPDLLSVDPQWGATDAEIKVTSDANAEFKCSPFKA